MGVNMIKRQGYDGDMNGKLKRNCYIINHLNFEWSEAE